jgi:hypothetical protein
MLLQSTAMTATHKDLPTDPAPRFWNPSIFTGAPVASTFTVGAPVAGNSNSIGAFVGTTSSVGAVVVASVAGTEALGATVGIRVVGEPEGFLEGDADGVGVGAGVGDMLGSEVGAGVGLAVGSGAISKAMQVLLVVVVRQEGAKSSNCFMVSKTAAYPQIDPKLFSKLISEVVKVLPKTTVLETPTTLFRKHDCSTVKGPKVSIRKLFVAA